MNSGEYKLIREYSDWWKWHLLPRGINSLVRFGIYTDLHKACQLKDHFILFGTFELLMGLKYIVRHSVTSSEHSQVKFA